MNSPRSSALNAQVSTTCWPCVLITFSDWPRRRRTAAPARRAGLQLVDGHRHLHWPGGAGFAFSWYGIPVIHKVVITTSALRTCRPCQGEERGAAQQRVLTTIARSDCTPRGERRAESGFGRDARGRARATFLHRRRGTRGDNGFVFRSGDTWTMSPAGCRGFWPSGFGGCRTRKARSTSGFPSGRTVRDPLCACRACGLPAPGARRIAMEPRLERQAGTGDGAEARRQAGGPDRGRGRDRPGHARDLGRRRRPGRDLRRRPGGARPAARRAAGGAGDPRRRRQGGGRRSPVRARPGAARRPRHPDQQRRHRRADRADRGDRARRLAALPRGQPHRPVSVRAARRADAQGRGRRLDRQFVLGRGPLRLRAPDAVLRLEMGRGRASPRRSRSSSGPIRSGSTRSARARSRATGSTG